MMDRNLERLLLILTLSVSGLAMPVQAQQQEPHRLQIDGEHTQTQFAVSGRLRALNARLRDAFLAGGEVSLEGVQADDLYLAGGSLHLRDSEAGDLVIAGGEVSLDRSRLHDDVLGGGGRFRTETGTRIDGNLVVAAGQLQLRGDIGGQLVGAAGQITLSGNIDGDVHVATPELVIDPGARIGGRLVYRSPKAAQIAEQAVIAGGVERLQMPKTPEVSTRSAVLVIIGVVLVGLVGLVLLAVLLQVIAPVPFHRALVELREHGMRSWLIGFALLVAAPVAANLMLATLIGIPTALLAYTAYALILFLGGVTAACWTGSWFAADKRPDSPAPRTAVQARRAGLGMLVLAVVGVVPLVGWVLLLIAVPLGLGAFASISWRALRARPA